MSATKSQLELDLLHERHSGITPSLGGALTEAACVCLDRHHVSPVEIDILCNSEAKTCVADFIKPNRTALSSWANEIDTTEWGAYCVSFAAVEFEERLVVVARAQTLSGADWYVGPIGSDPEDLENCFKLEVSGTDVGNRSTVHSRLKAKIEQAKKGKSKLPAIASVVGFKERLVEIEKVAKI
jgi:hypothetical protein